MVYWVQIELQPVGENTGHMHIDFDNVLSVHAQKKNKEVFNILMQYKDSDKLCHFPEYSAKRFYEAWCKYLEETNPLKHADKEAEPSHIHVANQMPNLIGMN